MNAWKRTLCTTYSALLTLGLGLTPMGCSSGSYSLEAQITPIGGYVRITFTPLEEGELLDLDGKEYVIVYRNGKQYRFYPSLGIIVDASNGQMYRLDDESWERVLRQLQQGIGTPILHRDSPIPEEVHRELFGLVEPNLKAGMGFMHEFVTVEIHLHGDIAIPTLDSTRWPSLQRSLFIFPDGVEESPDDLRMELVGEPSDVFGYMQSVGMTDGSANVANQHWSLLLNEEFADLFIDDAFFTTIPLH